MCFRSPWSLYKCGKCPECLSDKRRDWSIRLQLHSLYSGQKPYIAHLTYDNDNLPRLSDGTPTLCKKDVQDFIKRLRYYEKERKISYFLCGEYGPQTSRPHYHCIFFGFDENNSQDLQNSIIQKAWQKGFVRRRSQWVKSYAQLHYVTKYVINFYEQNNSKVLAPFRLASNSFGKAFVQYAKDKNLYPMSIQDKFVCTTKIRIQRNKSDKGYSEIEVPDKWLNEIPVSWNEETKLFDINPILKNFNPYIQFYQIDGKKHTAKMCTFKMPRYFSEKLFTKSFRMALALRFEAESFNKFVAYCNENADLDLTRDVPYWLDEKRLSWNRKKKNYKDKLYFNSNDYLNE